MLNTDTRFSRSFLILSALAVALVTLSACSSSSSSEESTSSGNKSQSAQANQFIGKVTAYGANTQGYGGDDESTIYVDKKRVDLDLIWPYSAGCMEREILQDKAFSSAREALEKTLHIGQRVLVVYSNYENGEWVGDQSKAFVHILTDGDKPKVSPPADSVNERLVRTGYWVPLSTGIDFDTYDFNATYSAFNPDYLSQIQEDYVPHILDAGNAARTQQSGSMPICSTLALDYQIDFFYKQVAAFRNDEEKNRLWWVERNKARNCRDGDGDGVCYER